MAQSILYYPTININDGTWLRNALLYWDHISSISPYDNFPDLSPELLYLQEKEIYKPIVPQDIFKQNENETDLFTKEIINKLERHKYNLSNKNNAIYSKTRMHSNKIPSASVPTHYEKFAPDLFKYLKEHNYIHSYERQGWFELDSKVSDIYMRYLAEFVVKNSFSDIVIGTDHSQYYNSFYRRTSTNKSALCASIALNKCLPQPSMNVSFEDLIAFKRQHKEDLLELRKKLRDFESDISKCTEINEIATKMEDFKENWQTTLKKDKTLFTKEKITFVLGTLNTLINLPSTTEALNNALQSINNNCTHEIAANTLLGGTATIALGYRFFSYKNKISNNRSSSGFSYMLHAHNAGLISNV